MDSPNVNDKVACITNIGLSMIVCTYQRPELMKIFFESFATLLPQEGLWELLVVDNAGDMKTKELTEMFAHHIDHLVRYTVEPKTGLCHARNHGVNEAKYDYICLLDDDVTFDEHFLEKSLKVISTGNIDVFIPRIRCPIDENWPGWLKTRVSSGVGQYEAGEKEVRLKGDYKLPVGAAVIYRKSLHEECGLFNVNLDRIGKNLFGGGETAFFKWARNGGASMKYQPDMLVYHHLTREKWNKSYWYRQGFFGGRSHVRMTNLFGHFGIKDFGESLLKSLYWALGVVLKPGQGFKSQYHMLAHLGRCYEYIVMLFAAKKQERFNS